jgi:3-oxoacyl-[acyl-carrier protein] reductase
MSGVALIIGGASGIGAASARLLAADGFAVAIADLQTISGKHVYQADISDEASVIALFNAVEKEMGPIAVLVVASGTIGFVDGKRPTLRATSLDNWDKVQGVNARGPFLAVREMLRHREATSVQDARIILIASMAAQNSAVNSPPAYVASKGAVLALTKVAAGEGATLGVTVNAIAPGAIDTPLLRAAMPVERDAAYFGGTVAGRAGSADEVAAAVRFLASPGSSYINGSCLDVNGGMLMR